MNRNDERARGVAQAQVARAELYDTLGQLRNRLDYAQRIDDATDRLMLRVEEQKRERPLVFAAGVIAVATIAGTVVWAIARGAASRIR